MDWKQGEFTTSSDRDRLQIEAVHRFFIRRILPGENPHARAKRSGDKRFLNKPRKLFLTQADETNRTVEIGLAKTAATAPARIKSPT
jgi:hypothetical protein